MSSEFIKRIPAPTVRVRNPEGRIFILNEYEFLNLRMQIKRNETDGWKWLDENDLEHDIDAKGQMKEYPKSLNLMWDLCVKMVQIGER